MIGYFTELFNIASALAVTYPLILWPLWEARGVKDGFVRGYIICHAVLACAALLIARRFIVMDLNAVQALKLCLLFAQLPLPVIAFRKRIWQAVFLIAVCLLYGPICTGIGNYIAESRFPDNALLFSGIINIAAVAVTFPPLIIILRRLYKNPGAESGAAFWRLAWIIPLSFHALNIAQGTYLSGSDFGFWFISVRVISYIVSLLVCYIFDIVTRQIAEAEKVKQEAEKLAERTAFYHRMAHDLLTPLTKVSTNVQIARELKPDDLDELLQKSQDEIMKMAGMINKALGGGSEARRG